MRTSTLLSLVIPVLLAAACNTEEKPPAEIKKDTVVVVAPPPPPVNDKIRNNITLKSNILKVSQAFLVDAEGAKIPDDNLTKTGQYITLRLIIDSGWVPNNGKVKLGASQKLVAADGTVISDEKDLFAEEDEVNISDANIIQVQALVENQVKLQDYYEVSFRVWDKIGAGDITGTYRFNIK